MPFKSDAQRKWMFANEPEMAKRWAKHTPKGKKLPKKVREMPHLDADVDVAGKHLHVVDLRIEKYPIPESEKKRLFRAFYKTGLVGDLHGDLLHFKPDYSVEVIDQNRAKQLPMLPHGWDRIMRFVSEQPISKLPTMVEVFKKRK